jgi:hypothetical protein
MDLGGGGTVGCCLAAIDKKASSPNQSKAMFGAPLQLSVPLVALLN